MLCCAVLCCAVLCCAVLCRPTSDVAPRITVLERCSQQHRPPSGKSECIDDKGSVLVPFRISVWSALRY